MKGAASVVINSLVLFARPARVLLAAFCGTIQRTNSAALQKTNTWIQLVSVLNSDMKFHFCSCLCLVNLCWLAKILTDITFLKKKVLDCFLKWMLLRKKGGWLNGEVNLKYLEVLFKQYSALFQLFLSFLYYPNKPVRALFISTI